MSNEKKEKRVEVQTDERSAKILEDLFLPGMKTDPFCGVVMDSVSASANHNLPLSVRISGGDVGGRIAMVTNALCTMITMELFDDEAEGMEGKLATVFADVISFDENGERLDGEPHAKTRILQLSVNGKTILPLIAALTSSLSDTYMAGSMLIVSQNMTEPDDDDDAIDGEDPIPFPTPDVGPETEPKPEVRPAVDPIGH